MTRGIALGRLGGLVWVALAFAPSCGGGGGSGGGGSGGAAPLATCPSPCFAWQYCDAASRTCLGTACYNHPVAGKSGATPDTDECGATASCDFSAGGTDALGNAYGHCAVIACTADGDCDDGRFCDGAETCGAATKTNPRGCVTAAPPCAAAICDEVARNCCAGAGGDQDGDGHRAIACGGDDCDDTDPNRYPGNPEVCDAAGHDEDCNDATFGPDLDGDGFVSTACCNKQPSGTLLCGTDCDDTRATINPAAVETCNGVDDDCNGMIDDKVTVTVYPDEDQDGYGAAGSTPVQRCPQDFDMGFSIYDDDCDDKNPAVVPGSIRCEANPTQATAWPVSICTGGVWTASTCEKGLTCTTQPNQTGVCW